MYGTVDSTAVSVVTAAPVGCVVQHCDQLLSNED